MSDANRGRIIAWLMALVASVPLLLYAYQGTFSRIIADDFRNLAIGRILGPWDGMLHWREVHNGSFSYYFMHGVVAPLDTLLPSIAPAVIIAAWLLGLIWLFGELLEHMSVKREKRLIAVSLAALTIAASIYALYIPHAFFWYSASARYPWPLALLLIFFAATLRAATSLRTDRALYLSALAGAFYCFVVGGFAELHALTQVSLVTLLLVLLFAFMDKARRRPYIIMLGACWIASGASLLVQLSAPGVHRRLDENLAGNIWSPIRSLPDLVTGTIDLTFQNLGHQEAFAGFMMLAAVSLFLTLRLCNPAPSSLSRDLTLGRAPLALGFIVQLCFVPILWTHVSDNPQVFSRFSMAFATVVAINTAMALGFLVLLWRRNQLEEWLSRRPNRWLQYCAAMLGMAVILFALTQLRSIHYKAATFLFLSTLVTLLILCWQFSAADAEPRVRKSPLYGVSWLVTTALIIAALSFASLYTQGGIQPRIMSSVAFMQVVGGLIWGSLLGVLLKRSGILTEVNATWITVFQGSSLFFVFVICGGIVYKQVNSIPDLAAFAEEWDARHELMLSYRDSGRTDVQVPPLKIDITEYFCCSNLTSADNANNYYGFRQLGLGRESS